MDTTNYVVPFLIILVVCIGFTMIANNQAPIEHFAPTCQGLVTTLKEVDDVSQLYQNWGNGGIENDQQDKNLDDHLVGPLTPYIWPYDLPPQSVREPSNTLVDQSICNDYAKRTCLGVTGFDRFDTCVSGQYNTCMDGRKRLVWPTNVGSQGDDAYPIF